MDGGSGSDVLVLLGHSSDYKISFGSSAVVLEAEGNKITAVGVEFVQFGDKTIALLAKANKPPVSPKLTFGIDEGACHEPFDFRHVAVNSNSSAHLHVRCTPSGACV